MLIEGIITFISPCLLPMVPIYITYIVGDNKEDKGRAIFNSVGFVIGFTIVFMLLAVFASILGRYVSEYMHIIKIIFGIIMILFGLNFMEVINLKFLNLSNNIKIKTNGIGFLKAMLFGILFSITWTPCVGSLLGTALMMVAKQGEILKGVIMLLIYSIGLGIPFIICAVLIDKLKSKFEFIKKHYNIIRNVSGLFLIMLGVYTIIN